MHWKINTGTAEIQQTLLLTYAFGLIAEFAEATGILSSCGQLEFVEHEYYHVFAICVALQFYLKNDGMVSDIRCYPENQINKGAYSAL